MTDPMINIRKACGDVEKRIKACRNRKIAGMLKKQLCQELFASCESETIQSFLINYVDSIIDAVFDSNGKNKYLEENYV